MTNGGAAARAGSLGPELLACDAVSAVFLGVALCADGVIGTVESGPECECVEEAAAGACGGVDAAGEDVAQCWAYPTRRE